MSRKSYQVGNVFFPGLQTFERDSSGNLGTITIGGDRGDVHASSATNDDVNDEWGVMLWDVCFLTTLDLNDDEVRDAIDEVVSASYESIQEEAFRQSRKQ